MADMNHETEANDMEIAVIGLAGRFPEAADIHQFWENLKNGLECFCFFNDQELEAAGVPADLIHHPDYVRGSNLLTGKDLFDAAFFGYTPDEALAMDPQVRLFHECAWHALEDAAYDPAAYPGLIGIYAGVASSFNWQLLCLLKAKDSMLDHFEASLLNERDYLCTRLAYKLNLRGPGVLVDTACSTSLVTIHLACQALLNGECDLALSGGVKLAHSRQPGYLYRQDMVESSDGHCRAFDAGANGTVGGEGCGVVVLKRLADALKDRDFIYAKVLGSAINNDGTDKVGFTAPAVRGQDRVIRAALEMAEVTPDSIGYIETHGTGTQLGDPIEIKALIRAFATDQTGFCRIGSVKSNIGHLDRAAGAAGFIKAVLALRYRQIPPSLHFDTPNREIDFDHSPFRVNTSLWAWEEIGCPRRAGVSSFGIGGTNAHIVLEEFSADGGREEAQTYQLIVCSARTETALRRLKENLAAFFRRSPDISLGDAAYTLQVGRRPFPFRQALVCRQLEEAADLLDGGKSRTHFAAKAKPFVVFMFSGQGNQYVNMGLDLYRHFPVFRQEMDRCFEIINSLGQAEVKAVVYPPDQAATVAAEEKIHQFIYTSPLKFAFEYALARLLIHWGIRPDAMIGHSFGEYVAACLAGVFSLEDALNLALWRGRLLHELPEGAMLSVPLSEAELQLLLEERKALSLAAVNGPGLCIVSGPPVAVRELEAFLEEKGLEGVRLRVSRAGHSPLMAPIADAFRSRVAAVKRREPQIPYISGLTGEWIEADQAVSPDYWARHLCGTIRFYEGITELLKEPGTVLIQVGPGRGLTMFVDQNPHKQPGHLTLDLVRRAREEISDVAFILDRLGLLWGKGLPLDWHSLHDRNRRRLPLPGYPFDRRSYWIEGDPLHLGAQMLANRDDAGKRRDMADWFYIPSWELSVLPGGSPPPMADRTVVLVLADDCGLGERLAERFNLMGGRVSVAVLGETFGQIGEDRYAVNPQKAEDYRSLLEALASRGRVPDRIIHLWGLTVADGGELTAPGVGRDLERGYNSLLRLVKALTEERIGGRTVDLTVIANHVHLIGGDEELAPAGAAALTLCRVIGQEFRGGIPGMPRLTCRHLEVVFPHPCGKREQQTIDCLVEELTSAAAEPVVAYRGRQRWVQTYKPVPLTTTGQRPPCLKDHGVYLITGAPGRYGSVGFILARWLARQVTARLILVSLTPLPVKEEWGQWLAQHPADDPLSRKIRQVQELEEVGAEVMAVSADVADLEQLREVKTGAEERFGRIDGIIHAAAVMGEEAVGLIADDLALERSCRQFRPKIDGLLNLYELFKDQALDFCLLTSSLAAVLGGIGFGAYGAANSFLDAFAHWFNRDGFGNWISVNWDNWQRLDADRPEGQHDFMSPAQGAEAFGRILSWARAAQVVTSTTDLLARLREPESEEAANFMALRKQDPAEWLYRPCWKPVTLNGEDRIIDLPQQNWLVFAEESVLSSALIRRLRSMGQAVVTVRAADMFGTVSSQEYTLDPAQADDYGRLFEKLVGEGLEPDCIVHLWGVSEPGECSLEGLDSSQDLGLYSLIEIARAVGSHNITRDIRLAVVTAGMQSAAEREKLACPLKATMLGPAKIIPLEYANMTCRSIDIRPGELPAPGKGEEAEEDGLVRDLLLEFRQDFSPFRAVAYRGGRRLVQAYEPIKPQAAGSAGKKVRLREKGVYLITGGLGGLGLAAACYLARTRQARLLLTDSAEVSPDEEGRRRVRELEAAGADIMICRADVADYEQMREAVTRGEERFGPLNGVIHSAGLIDEAGVMQRRSRGQTEAVLAPRVRGTMVLDRLLGDRPLDFLVLFSSIGNVLYGAKFGQVAYNAGHEFLEVFAHYKQQQGLFAVTVDWTDWQEVGMAVRAVGPIGPEDPLSISPQEGMAVLERILAGDDPQVVVSPLDLEAVIRYFNEKAEGGQQEGLPTPTASSVWLPRPALGSDYAAPGSEAERKLCTIFQRIFGLEAVGIDDDFFELGGDSIKAMTVAATIHKAFDTRVPLAEFFKLPTVRGLAGYLVKGQGSSRFRPIRPVEQREYYPLSSMQKRLYILQQIDLEVSGYNETAAYEIEGAVDRRWMQRVLADIVARHESLRTYFVLVDDEPVQRLQPPQPFKIEYDDSPTPSFRDFVRPFDLSTAPLLRVGLVRVAAQRHILLLDIHHIITDGTSMKIFVEDIMSVYGGRSLAPLRVQYKDYTLWLEEAEQAESRQQQGTYWFDRFAGEIPVLHLPYDFPRPALQSFAGSDLVFEVDAVQVARLKKLVRAENVTLFIWIVAVYDILLARLSGQQEIVVGTPTAGRRHADLNALIGMFVNTLALKNGVREDLTFRQFLQQVKTTTLGAFENQDYQFEDLVDRLAVNRDTGRNPLFDVMFSLHNMTLEEKRHGEVQIPGLTLKPYDFDYWIAKFDLTLVAAEAGDRLFFTLSYCTQLFRPDTAARFQDYFLKIFYTVLEEPEVPLSTLDIITASEKEEILTVFNRGRDEVPFPRQKTFHRLFGEQAVETPDRLAVVCRDRQLTYGALNGRADGLASVLRDRGAVPDRVVGIMVRRSLDMITAVMGVLKSGAAYLPVDPAYPPERSRYMLTDSEAVILLTDDAQRLPAPANGPVILEIGDLPTDGPAGAEAASPANLAYLIYTSGSTGKPKGVMVQHDHLVNAAWAWRREYRLREMENRLLQMSSFSFDVFAGDLARTLVNGGLLAINPETTADPIVLYDLILRQRISLFESTPAFIIPFMTYIYDNRLDTGPLQLLILGSDSCPARDFLQLMDRFGKRLRIVNSYGVTEATIDSSFYEGDLENVPPGGNVPIGKPLPNMRFYVLNRLGHLQPVGVAGELYIGGRSVARGYFQQEALTRQRFLADPFFAGERMYRTGDAGRWLPDGNMEFLGRLDYQVKIRGYRIELEEIEKQLLKADGIKEAVVTARQDRRGDKYLCAYIVPQTSPTNRTNRTSPLQVREYLSRTLPDYMIPALFVSLERLPLTPNGKIDRRALPEPGTGLGGHSGYVPPRDQLERDLTAIWAQILGVEPGKIGLDHNFFEMGGNSLKALNVVIALKRKMNVNLPLKEVFGFPTLQGLAAAIRRQGGGDYREEPEYVVFNPGQAEKVFCFPPQVAYGLAYHKLATLVDDYAFYSFNFVDGDGSGPRYVDLILRTQAKGPFVLFGYSSGGMLAFEVARQLIGRGQRVSDIVMFDTPCNYRAVDESAGKEEAEIREILDSIRDMLKDDPQLERQAFDRMKAYGRYIDRLEVREPLPVNIHMVRSDHVEPVLADYSWQPFTGGHYREYPGSGRHEDMLKPRHIGHNARIVREILAGIDGERSGRR